MPGYRPLRNAETLEEVAAASRADALSRDGRDEEAVLLLERLIAELEEADGELPMWPYGRLAFLYRRMRRYRDEVALLERYISVQADSEQAVRFNARLSKARSLAEMHRLLADARRPLESPRAAG
jgi:hypothetical protein